MKFHSVLELIVLVLESPTLLVWFTLTTHGLVSFPKKVLKTDHTALLSER